MINGNLLICCLLVWAAMHELSLEKLQKILCNHGIKCVWDCCSLLEAYLNLCSHVNIKAPTKKRRIHSTADNPNQTSIIAWPTIFTSPSEAWVHQYSQLPLYALQNASAPPNPTRFLKLQDLSSDQLPIGSSLDLKHSGNGTQTTTLELHYLNLQSNRQGACGGNQGVDPSGKISQASQSFKSRLSSSW